MPVFFLMDVVVVAIATKDFISRAHLAPFVSGYANSRNISYSPVVFVRS
jgi:hypothetical protein